jgi:hypothetical protein
MSDDKMLSDHLIDIGRGLCSVGVMALGASASPGGLAIGIYRGYCLRKCGIRGQSHCLR